MSGPLKIATIGGRSGLQWPAADAILTAVKPREVRMQVSSREEDAAMGGGLKIRAGISTCPFGGCLIGESPLGICHLSLFDPGLSAGSVAEFLAEWPGATVVWDHAHAAKLAKSIFSSRDSRAVRDVHVRGTPFQIRVWQALVEIPLGAVVSYGELARTVGHPGAARATGSAVGSNEVSILIPCHRVVRADGHRGQYRWGAERKSAILDWERAGT